MCLEFDRTTSNDHLKIPHYLAIYISHANQRQQVVIETRDQKNDPPYPPHLYSTFFTLHSTVEQTLTRYLYLFIYLSIYKIPVFPDNLSESHPLHTYFGMRSQPSQPYRSLAMN